MIANSKSSSSSYRVIQKTDLERQKISHILLVSDLHMSEGYSRETFRWQRIENFPFDKTFNEFLRKKTEEIRREGFTGWLIINGDFIDFLRIVSTPKSQKDLDEWKNVLDQTTSLKLKEERERERVLGAFKDYADLWQRYVLSDKKPGKPLSAIRDELKYGFKTHDFKSVYRLMLAVKGHLPLYKALTEWLGEGHPITIITGNHDEEFTQELVRAALLWFLEDLYQQEHKAKTDFTNLLTFENIGLVIDDKICIEHGHRFEPYTCTDKEFESEHHELFLAPGSLFNRYLINRLELAVPYFDNIRPTTRVIGFLIKKHPIRFFQSLIKMFATAWRLIRKKGNGRLIVAGALKIALLLPTLLYGFWFFFSLPIFRGGSWQKIWHGVDLFFGLSFAFYIAIPFFVIYFWIINKFSQKLRLYFSEEKAKEQMIPVLKSESENGACYAICGHTHVPDIKYWTENVLYINSGTWTPVFDYEMEQARYDLTMTFIELKNDGERWQAKLARWLPYHNVETDLYLIEDPN